MPNSVDNKIVEMQFDNADFEKNVRQSIKTLEKLNKALELEDAGKGFQQMEEAANSIDLSKLMNAADVIEKRFSAAGIAGAAFIQRGVNGAINLVERLGSKVVNLAKTGGINRALNLEHANFMLEGILKDADRVAQVINGPVNDAVSGTAYGLDSAAKAAGQFVASGVTDLEKLRVALTGISGVAAMSGASYDEIARIFNKVAARGKVMGDTIQELSTRGIAAQEELAKHLKVTVAEVQDLQKKGKISFEAFSEAMYDAFAAQAKKANETFTGAMSNVRAALSRIGAKIATPTIENLRKILVILIDVVNKINSLLSARLITNINNLIDRVALLTRNMLQSKKFMDVVEKTINNITDAFDILSGMIRPVKEAFKTIFPGSALDRMNSFNDIFAALLKKLEMTGEKAAGIRLTLQGLFATVDIFFTIVKQIFDVLLPGMNGLYNSTDSLSTKILKITGFIGFLLTKFDKWLKQNNLLKIGLDKLNSALGVTGEKTITISSVINGVLTVIGGVLKGIVFILFTVGNAAGDFLRRVYELPVVQRIVNDIKNAIYELGVIAIPVLGTIAAGFVTLLESIMKFGEGNYLDRGLDKLNTVLNNLYWGFQNVVGGIKAFFGIFNKSTPAVEKIESVTVATEKLYASAKGLESTSGVVVRNVENMSGAITTTANTLEQSGTKASNTLMTLNEAGKIFAIGFGASVISAAVNIGRAFRAIGKVARNLASTTKSIRLFFDQLQLNLRIKTLLSLAVAIAVFAGSLALLCQMDSKKLLLAAGAIGILTFALSRVAKALASPDIKGVKNFKKAAEGLVSLAAALLILAGAIKLLSTIVVDVPTFISTLVGLIEVVALMYALAGAVILIENKQKKAIKGSMAMLAIASSVYIMMSSLQKIQTLDLDAISKALPLMLKIVGGMAGLALAMSLTISPLGGFAFMGIVAGILLLFEGLSQIQKVDNRVVAQVEQIIDRLVLGVQHIIFALIALQAFQVAESIFTWLTTKATGLVKGLKGMFMIFQKGVKYIGVAAMVIAIGASIALMADAIISLGAMWEQNRTAMLAAGAFVLGLSLIIGIMSTDLINLTAEILKASGAAKAAGPALIGISLIMISFAGTIAILGNIKPEVVQAGIERLLGLSVICLGFIAVLSLIEKYIGPMIRGSVKVLIGLAALLGLMVTAVAILALIPADDANRAIASIFKLAVSLGIVLAAVSTLGQMTAAASAAVWGIAAVFFVLGVVAKIVSDVYAVNILGTLAALEIAVLGMIGIIWLLSTAAAPTTIGLVALAGITGCMILLAGVAEILSQLNVKTFEQNMEMLYGAVVILGLAVVALGALSELAGPGVLILIGIAAAMKLFSDAAVGFAEAARITGESFSMIADALVKMNNTNFEVIIQGLNDLYACMTKLSSLSESITTTGNALQSVIVPISGLGNAMLLIATGVNAFLNIDLSGIMAQFIKLGEAISFVNDRALEFGGFSVIAIAVGASLLVLGGGIITVTAGLVGFAAAVDLVCFGISILVDSVSTLGEVVLKITNAVTSLVESLKKLGEDTVNQIYVTLMEYASKQLYEAGQDMVIHIVNGFKDRSAREAPKMISYLMTLVRWAADENEQSAYDAGYYIFSHLRDGATDSISEIGTDIVDTMYDATVDYAEERLKDVGSLMCSYIEEGFRDSVADVGRDIVEDTINSIREACEYYKQDVYNAAEENIGIPYDEGVRDPTSSYCTNDHVELPHDSDESIEQATKEVKGNIYRNGTIMGNSYGSGVWDKIKNWFSRISAEIKKFGANPLEYVASALSGGGTNAVSSTIEEFNKEFAKMTNRYDTKYFRATYMTGIGWVDHHGKVIDKAADSIKNYSSAVDGNTSSIEKNTSAGGKSSKAKTASTKADKEKTKAITEETKALETESEAMSDNEQAIREQAEQIEVVTEKFNESLNYLGLRDPFKMAGKSISAIGKLWAQTADDSTNSLSNINKVYKDLLKTIPSSTDTIKRGLYAFNSETGKYLRKSKLTTQVTKSAKKIEKQVSKTGKTVAKVAQDTAKIFYKENGTVNKMTIGLTKNIKNLGKKFIEAKKFVKDFGDGFDKALKTETSEDFVRTFRTIENTFNGVANKKLPKQIQTYMKTVHEQFQDFDSSMSILSKRIGGTYDVMSKNSKVTPYVEDAFISLAATLYDGSEAANEYATEMARLEFLFENGLATEEEVAEKRRWYIDRIREALQEYKDTLDQTYTSQMDLWSAFDKHSLEEGTDVISNVESWIGGMKTFSDMSQVLSARLPKVAASSALITELLEEGFQGYGKMEALLKLTDAELALFVYDYQQAQDTIKNTADAALATIADSTTWASKRAAAASQDAAKRTLKFSKQVRAEQEDNIKAVARAMVENDKLRKKQEKKFLANLTKDQKKIYKAQKKEEKRLKKQADAQRKIHDEEVKRKQAEEAAQEAAEKAAQAEEEARQKAEEAKQAEEERVNTILEAIKTYENYYEAIKKYNGDVGVMTKLTEKLADALKPVAQYVSDISASSNDVRALISFTEALGNDGSEVSDVFSDINSKLESYISNIRNATKATNDFFNEVAEGSSISISEMLGNYVANTGNTTEFRRLLLQMSSLGYSADAINFIAEAYSSNRADTLAKMRLLVNATTEEIYAYNHVIENANEESKKAQQDAVTAARQNAEAVYKARIKAAEEESAKAKKAMESALSDVNTKKSVRDEVSNEIKRIDTEIEYATQYYNELKEKRDKLANAKTEAESDYKLLDKLVGTNNAKWLAQNDKKIAALIEKYGTSNVMSLRSQIENAYVMSRHRNSELDILENELKHADYHLNKLKDIQSNLKKHEAEAISNLNAAEKAYTESERAYAATVKAENDARNSYANEKERQDQLAREYLERQKVVKETLEQIISYETLIKVLRNTKIPAYAIVEVNKRLKDSFAELTDGIDAYGESFLGISKLSESTSDTLTETQFTFLKFAETLDKVSDETGDFFDDMSKRLKNYRDSLYDTIKGQVSLFDEFKKFSGETATSASTYLDNMASQLEGLEEWVEGMETLSKRGVSGDILDMFAQEGQASYEKVAAFVNATDAQLGELVSQYEKYKILTQKAADRTFAAVANSYSAASEKAMKNLLDTFQKNGIERFADATAEASAEAVQTSTKMIIEGIADGMSNAMPKIVEVATETGEILSETMTTAVATPETVTAMTENLTNTVSTASVSATTEMVDRFKMAVDSINQMIDENLNTDPVITPHIDTTEFDAAIARMNSAISSVQARAAQAQAAVSAASSASTTNNSQTSTSTTTINYTQNNTSPKALDQVELYRLTNSSLNRVLGLNGYTGKVVKK